MFYSASLTQPPREGGLVFSVAGDSIMLLRYLFAPLLLCFVTAASPCNAILIEANFAGGAGGIAPYDDNSGNYRLNGFSTTFTAQFFFDTVLSAVQQTAPGVYWLTGLAYGSITLASIGGNPSYGNGPYSFGVFGDGTLVWQDGVGPTLANVGYGYNQIFVQLGDSGGFQNGLCPSFRAPCGQLFATSSELIGAFPVPGPVVGAGLPGLLMAVAGFIGWRRRRRHL